MRRIVAALLLVLLATGASRAEMLGELRGGLLAGSDGDALLSSTPFADANVEFAFLPMVDTIVAGALHPVVGVTANLGGGRSFGYAGLNWRVEVPVPITPVFFEAGLGGALSSDAIGGSGSVTGLGCAAYVEAQGSVGTSLLGVADLMLTAQRFQPVSGCGGQARTELGIRAGLGF